MAGPGPARQPGGHLTGQRLQLSRRVPGPARGIVAEEQYGRRPAQHRELTGGPGDLTETDGDQHEVVLVRTRMVDDAGRGLGTDAAQHIAGGQATHGDAVGARWVAEDMDRVSRSGPAAGRSQDIGPGPLAPGYVLMVPGRIRRPGLQWTHEPRCRRCDRNTGQRRDDHQGQHGSARHAVQGDRGTAAPEMGSSAVPVVSDYRVRSRCRLRRLTSWPRWLWTVAPRNRFSRCGIAGSCSRPVALTAPRPDDLASGDRRPAHHGPARRPADGEAAMKRLPVVERRRTAAGHHRPVRRTGRLPPL